MNNQQRQLMEQAIALSLENVILSRGGPFGALIVKDNEVIAQGKNQVTVKNDPTAHAEIVAIRQACQKLETFQLKGCELYTSCEPCPMCLGAIYWAKLERVYYANTQEDAAAIGFDDQFIYQELRLPIKERQLPLIQIRVDEAKVPFLAWLEASDTIDY
jgi:tRNA(Arg) A34 adenosine deaminase TadA